MKEFIVGLILYSFSLLCQSQEVPLFKIISIKGLVTVDGNAMQCGQTITSTNKKLSVDGSDSYVCVLTEKGYAFKLGQGKWNVKSVYGKKNTYLKEQKLTFTWGVHYTPSEIQTMSGPGSNVDLVGDSLTIIWKCWPKCEPNYKIRILDLYENPICDTIVYSNVTTVTSYKMFEKEKTIQVQVKNSLGHDVTGGSIVRSLDKKIVDKFMYDLQCSESKSFLENKLNKIALCEMYNLYYDQIHHLYKLWQYSKENQVEINNKYYQRLLKYYQFDTYFTKDQSSN